LIATNVVVLDLWLTCTSWCVWCQPCKVRHSLVYIWPTSSIPWQI